MHQVWGKRDQCDLLLLRSDQRGQTRSVSVEAEPCPSQDNVHHWGKHTKVSSVWPRIQQQGEPNVGCCCWPSLCSVQVGVPSHLRCSMGVGKALAAPACPLNALNLWVQRKHQTKAMCSRRGVVCRLQHWVIPKLLHTSLHSSPHMNPQSSSRFPTQVTAIFRWKLLSFSLNTEHTLCCKNCVC
jgi:hypothetical protein